MRAPSASFLKDLSSPLLQVVGWSLHSLLIHIPHFFSSHSLHHVLRRRFDLFALLLLLAAAAGWPQGAETKLLRA
jgi:hypothetical protein